MVQKIYFRVAFSIYDSLQLSKQHFVSPPAIKSDETDVNFSFVYTKPLLFLFVASTLFWLEPSKILRAVCAKLRKAKSLLFYSISLPILSRAPPTFLILFALLLLYHLSQKYHNHGLVGGFLIHSTTKAHKNKSQSVHDAPTGKGKFHFSSRR